MNDAQTWTVIGGFLAILAAMAGLVLRIVTTEIRGLRGEVNGKIDGLRGEVNGKFDGLRGEINARFNAVDRRFDHLDRDVQALTRRVFGVGNE